MAVSARVSRSTPHDFHVGREPVLAVREEAIRTGGPLIEGCAAVCVWKYVANHPSRKLQGLAKGTKVALEKYPICSHWYPEFGLAQPSDRLIQVGCSSPYLCGILSDVAD
jgi:hypothetical protein